uniref:Uncharacterized protein n=1 Tax=Rhipicephalus zambeziensis TaxID=60191 RepID=A0A224YG97_9ACAR
MEIYTDPYGFPRVSVLQVSGGQIFFLNPVSVHRDGALVMVLSSGPEFSQWQVQSWPWRSHFYHIMVLGRKTPDIIILNPFTTLWDFAKLIWNNMCSCASSCQ